MKLIPVLILLLLASCTVLDEYKKSDFAHLEGNRHHQVALHVPRGFAAEKVLLDANGGKEQYYYYSDGSLFYITKEVSWLTENEPFIQALFRDTATSPFSFRGVDLDGLHWKEMRIDKFRFGYSYVPAGRLEIFEKALNSVKFK